MLLEEEIRVVIRFDRNKRTPFFDVDDEDYLKHDHLIFISFYLVDKKKRRITS